MKAFVTCIALIVCVSANAQKEKNIVCKWRDASSESFTPATSDYVVAKKGVFLYCLSNDDKNIYVDVKVIESIEENRVLQMGMTLWINTDGKSRRETGIRYPVGAKYSKGQGGGGGSQTNDLTTQITPLTQANTISLVGFKDVKPTKFPSSNTDNIRGTAKYDKDGNLLIAITIPMEKLPVAEKGSDKDVPAMNFAIEYGSPPSGGGQSGGPSGGPSGNAAPPSGSGGRPSGGGSRGGGAPPSMASGAQSAPDPVVFWIKDIKLAEIK